MLESVRIYMCVSYVCVGVGEYVYVLVEARRSTAL